MAFWKKSEDPWDVNPEKKRRKAAPLVEEPSAEEEKSAPFWSELFKKKDVPAEEELPVPCPYCGKIMQKGYLQGGRDCVRWCETKPGLWSGLDEAWLISDEGNLWTGAYRTSYLCEACRKLVVDVPEPAGPNYVWESGSVQPGEKEESGE